MKIKVFTVGGTIDKVYFDALSQYEVGFPTVREILDGLPIAFDCDIESLLRKDSLEMLDSDRALVKERIEQDPCNKIIVTHGTDTMVETARAIGDLDDKCVVLTGALEPSGFKSSDAVFNIGVAVGAVSSLRYGTHIAMNGCLFDPSRCRKNRQSNRFEHL